MDVAREQLDVDIANAERYRSMLEHLADAIKHLPTGQRRGETYQAEAMEALRYGAALAEDRRKNLEHVRAIYDFKAIDPGAVRG